MKALILAGGYGIELKDLAKDIPKPMISIAGKPFLEHQIKLLKENGITDIIIAIHHMGDIIKSYFGDGKRIGVNITYSEEDVPLGTAGAIKNSEKYLDDTFVVLNGDCYSEIDLKDFLEFHKTKRSKYSIAVTKHDSQNSFTKVFLNENKVTEFFNGEPTELSKEYNVSTGVYIFEPIILDLISEKKNISLENEIFPLLINENQLWGYSYEGYFMDIGKPDTYYKFKNDFLKNLLLLETEPVRSAMKKISKSGVDLVLIVDSSQRLKGVLNDRIIRNFLLAKGNIEDSVKDAMVKNLDYVAKISDDNSEISKLLQNTRHLPILDDMGKVVDIEFKDEGIKTESFPIIRGRAPFRISFAGGGTDLPQFFEKHGGVVINCTIDKYCYGTIIKRADNKIIINSDIDGEYIIDSSKDLIYNGKFDLIKAIITIMEPDFGFELYLHNDIPPGRGLGSSATFAVLVVKLISIMQGRGYDDYKIAEIAFKAETEELKIKGGWQDQYAAVTGGFSFMEFNGDKSIIYPLRLKEEVISDFNHHLLLCYVGKTHFSGDFQKDLEKSCEDNEEEVLNSLNELKNIATEIKDSLLINNLEEIGRLLHKSWLNKKKCGKNISNPNIDKLYEVAIQNGAYGGKILGAGGGGYLLFFISPKKRNLLVKELEKNNGEVMNFNFEFTGTKVWNVKSK
ncbi:NTP transferase domain-containing protein [Candidatus Pacearchaeota archaeon]|nr:NTP transferase domain-containing protein [Candidatus Pacearchaeota archaeon]